MHFHVEGVRRKVRALVATDAILCCQGAVCKLAAVRVLVAGATIIRASARVPLGERTVCLVALRTRHLVVWHRQGKGRVLMLLRCELHSGIVKLLMVKSMADDTTRIRLQPRS